MHLDEWHAPRLNMLKRLRQRGCAPSPARSARMSPAAAVLDDCDNLAAAEVPVTLVGQMIGARCTMGNQASGTLRHIGAGYHLRGFSFAASARQR